MSLELYSISIDGQSEHLETAAISGLKTIQGHLEFSDETNFTFLAFEDDKISKIEWNRALHSYRQSIYKIKTRSASSAISFMISGENYLINDAICQSIILFTASSEIMIGILIEDSIKFWSFTCDTSAVDSAVFSEELGLLYLNSHEKSGFFSVLR